MAKVEELPRYISRTADGVLQVRIPVLPEDRSRLPGKGEIKVSLRTKCVSEAAKRWDRVKADALDMREAAKPRSEPVVFYWQGSQTLRYDPHTGERMENGPPLPGPADLDWFDARMRDVITRDHPMRARLTAADEPEKPMPLASMTFGAMVDHWSEVNAGSPEESRAYHRMFRRLAVTVGYDDANRVTRRTSSAMRKACAGRG